MSGRPPAGLLIAGSRSDYQAESTVGTVSSIGRSIGAEHHGEWTATRRFAASRPIGQLRSTREMTKKVRQVARDR